MTTKKKQLQPKSPAAARSKNEERKVERVNHTKLSAKKAK